MAVCPRVLAGCVGLSLLASSSASAYCRTRTDSGAPATSCPEICGQDGLPLFWGRPDMTYAFNAAGFPALGDGQLRATFASSFQTWESVLCGGQSIGLTLRAKSATTLLEDGPESEEPNENVIAHFTADEWLAKEMPSHAFAITAVWFSSTDGEIVGADMLFNGGMDPFGECPPDGCIESDPTTDLRNVATHEIGHFLGLSHSDVPSATMWCNADRHETSKRSLSDDDVAGICAAYPPGTAFLRDASDGAGSHACSAGSGPAAGGGGRSWVGLLVALGCLLLRRRAARDWRKLPRSGNMPPCFS